MLALYCGGLNNNNGIISMLITSLEESNTETLAKNKLPILSPGNTLFLKCCKQACGAVGATLRKHVLDREILLSVTKNSFLTFSINHYFIYLLTNLRNKSGVD